MKSGKKPARGDAKNREFNKTVHGTHHDMTDLPEKTANSASPKPLRKPAKDSPKEIASSSDAKVKPKTSQRKTKTAASPLETLAAAASPDGKKSSRVTRP